MGKQLLFVSQDPTLTGAPMVLLHLLNWIRSNTNNKLTILLKSDGPLAEQFKACGEVFIWWPGQVLPSKGRRIKSALKLILFNKYSNIPFPERLKKKKFDLVYLNTVDTTSIALTLKKIYSCPILLHVHELSFSLNTYFAGSLAEAYKGVIDHYIAAAKIVKENLVTNHEIPANQISVYNEFIPVDKINKPTQTIKNN